MADNTEPTPTKTFNFRMSDSRTSTEIDASTDMRSMIAIAKDTEDVTVVTKTMKRDIPFGAEANTVASVNTKIGSVVLDPDDLDDSTTTNKFISATEITKLDGIEAGAEVNAVTSVNGDTGAVTLNADDIEATTDKNYTTDAQQTLLGNTTGTNSGDQDVSGIGTNASAITDIEAKTDFITVTQNVDLDTVESDTATNNGKVTNATHTGDVTGDTALTIADNVVTTAKISATGTPSASTFLRGDGSWGTADSGGSNATSIQSVPVDTAPVGALAHLKTFIAKWYSNLFLWSEDISQSAWIVLSGDTKDGTDGIVASTTSGAHGVYQGITFETGNYTFRAVVSAGDKDYFAMYSSGGGDGFNTSYFQLSTCSVISQLSDAVEINDLGGGECEILVQDAIVAGYKTPYVLASENGTSLSFIGDGSTVSIRVKELQVYKGTIAENFPYQKTTTTASSKQQIDWVDKDILEESTPASASATGTAGKIVYDADYIYMCTATDTWKRVAIATW